METAGWTQTYAPVGGALWASAVAAAVPIVVLGIMLGVRRAPAWRAAAAGLAGALVVALFVYRMPPALAAAATLYGAAFGLFPIGWVVFAAILLYDVAIAAGCFAAIEWSIGAVSADHRMQALLVGFAFGAFIEGASGFGTPVAVSASLLAALGFPPFFAAGLCLLANTAPVAYGALATPIVTLAAVTGLPLGALSAAVGRICPWVALIIPMYLLVVLAGWRRALEAWPAALVCGLAFGAVQFAVSNFVGPHLTDILSSAAAAAALVVLFKLWAPRDEFRLTPRKPEAARILVPARVGVWRAWAPYLLLVGLVLLWGAGWTQRRLDVATWRVAVPILHNAVLRTAPVTTGASPYPAVYVFNWLGAAGTASFVAAVLAAAVTGLGLREFARVLGGTARRLVVPELTIATVLALAYVMNYSGATATLGLSLAATGVLFPFFGAFLGWLGVFLTGSDTSANALFGNLQVVSARALSLNPVLMAAVNSSGGVLGKMISIQSIAVAAAATGMPRTDEGRLFRVSLKHSILLAAVVGVMALLFAYVFTGAMPQEAR